MKNSTLVPANLEMSTAELNSSLEIRKLTRLSRFKNEKGIYSISGGFTLFIEGLGYVCLNSKYPYSPVGGKSALKNVLSDGGLTAYDENVSFILPHVCEFELKRNLD